MERYEGAKIACIPHDGSHERRGCQSGNDAALQFTLSEGASQ